MSAGLAEWLDTYQIPVKLMDLDTENKARGLLTHLFGGPVPKVNIQTPGWTPSSTIWQAGICGFAAPRRCTPASPESRSLASASPALAPKCKGTVAQALTRFSHHYLMGPGAHPMTHENVSAWSFRQRRRVRHPGPLSTGHLSLVTINCFRSSLSCACGAPCDA
jgi:hypothetical protein